MTLRDLVSYYGTSNRKILSNKLGVSRQTISRWFNHLGYIPFERQYEIQKNTKNKLKADSK